MTTFHEAAVALEAAVLAVSQASFDLKTQAEAQALVAKDLSERLRAIDLKLSGAPPPVPVSSGCYLF